MQTTAKPRDDVKFCAVQRVGAHAFLVVCTELRWQVFRLDKFTSSRDSLTPVQLVVDDTRVDAALTNVRMVRLFRLPATDSNSVGLGGFFVTERCAEVDYSQPSADASDWQQSHYSSDDLTVFSFTEERVLHQLPPLASTVVDIQIQRSTAAVLCDSRDILLVDLSSFQIRHRISSVASLAMALGPRWIAYPEIASSALDDDSDSDDGEEIVPEALVQNGSRQLLASPQSQSLASTPSTPSPSYTAIDVAQNVASGIYFLSKTIAPYLSSSPPSTTQPSASVDTTPRPQPHPHHPSASTSTSSGWVTVQDVHTHRVVASFQCHSTALVHLAFDPSGCLLATSSTKGQNVHVYRLLPPLQQHNHHHSGGRSRHQLLYKLQRGITHASIADMAFSQDAKWLNVTSAHGTSHLYAIHPEGAPMSVHTHATVHTDGHTDVHTRDVSDFCASFRPVEPKTLARVVKLHHSLLAKHHTPAAAALAASTASTSYGSVGLGASSAFYYQSPPATLVGSALDASQALFSQLGIEFDADSWRGHHRRHRLSCLFAADGLKMVICCDQTLKLYDLSVHTPTSASTPPRVASAKVKTRSSPFGFDATVTELKTWDLLEMAGRVRTESLLSSTPTDSSTPPLRTSEIRTFLQRGLPLWAHPKVSFRVIDADHPHGHVLHIKRRGPSAQEFGGDGLLHGDGDDQQLFVMEMDSYFGLGGSPVFTGQSDQRVVPDVPRLDLAESINLAISTSLPDPVDGVHILKKLDTPPAKMVAKRKKGKTNSSSSSSSSGSSSLSTSASTSPTLLQFTLQDMYFAQPTSSDQS